MIQKINLLNFNIVDTTLQSCVDDVLKHLLVGEGIRTLACINPHSYVVSKSDPIFRESLMKCDYILPDGVGIVLASFLLRKTINNRLTGPDFFRSLISELNLKKNISVFFLGSTPETLNNIKLKLSRDYQNVKFGGAYSPPFKTDLEPDDVTKIINVVNQSKCNVLFIGLTAPKQEKLMKVISERVNVNFIACIGAEFDYFGETIKRPPQFISNIGLQWVQRLISQPRKIWRRVFISGAIFIKDVIREAIS